MSNNRFRFVVTNLLLMSLTFFFGCAGAAAGGGKGGRYLYNYTMIEPAVNDQLLFKDEYITIQFKLDESAIKFQLQNISELPIAIVWENVAVGLNNRVFPVKNQSTLYQTTFAVPPSVMIPSLGYVRDMVIPADYITFDKGEWKEKDLFPTNDMGSAARKKLIMKYNGSRIKLVLPIRIGEVVQDYTFIFRVKGISSLPENRLPPAKERPVPPAIVQPATSSSILPVVIAGGILALAIYAFSQEKSSPLNF